MQIFGYIINIINNTFQSSGTPFIFCFLKCYIFEIVREMGKFSLISPALTRCYVQLG